MATLYLAGAKAIAGKVAAKNPTPPPPVLPTTLGGLVLAAVKNSSTIANSVTNALATIKRFDTRPSLPLPSEGQRMQPIKTIAPIINNQFKIEPDPKTQETFKYTLPGNDTNFITGEVTKFPEDFQGAMINIMTPEQKTQFNQYQGSYFLKQNYLNELYRNLPNNKKQEIKYESKRLRDIREVEQGYVQKGFENLGSDIVNPLRPIHNAIEAATGFNLSEWIAKTLKPEEFAIQQEEILKESRKKGYGLTGSTGLKTYQEPTLEQRAGAAVGGFKSGFRVLGGERPYSDIPIAEEAGQTIGMTPYDLLFAAKYALKAYEALKDTFGEVSKGLLYKQKFIPPEELKTAFGQITSGVEGNASKEALAAAQDIIGNAQKGSSLVKQIQQGATVEVKRDFLGWFKKFFSDVPKESIKPEVQGLLDAVKNIPKEPQAVEKLVNNVMSVFSPRNGSLDHIIPSLQNLGKFAQLKGGKQGTPGIDVPVPLPEKSSVMKISDNLYNSPAGAEVISEMKNAQAPQRIIKEGEVIGIKSTFPDWIPETTKGLASLRSTPLFNQVISHLENGTIPKSKNAIDLYNLAKAEIEKRAELPWNTPVTPTANSTVAPAMQKPISGEGKVSRIAKSIETKAVEAKLTNGFSEIAEYTPITIKDQAAKATNLINLDIEQAIRIVRGEEALPEGLRGTSLITAMEEHIKANPDANLAYDLANSPLVSSTSLAAQEMRLAAERDPDSATAKLQEIKRAREAKAGSEVIKVAKKVKSDIQSETKKVHLSKEELSWDKFLSDIQC